MNRKGYEMGSCNVFQDLGVPNAEEHLRFLVALDHDVDIVVDRTAAEMTRRRCMYP